ncbi:MAG TPA: glutamate decarboxylase [Solirubrobacteraceae bacterium]|nr:glutamate decarboxylase [Solirubrobacteraceae bacterium]
MALSRQDERRIRHRPPRQTASVRGPRPELPIEQIPEKSMELDAAHELISSELLLDGQSRLNLATFVTTWMPTPAHALMFETADKNIIDKDEYPVTAEVERRCVNILADLWNAQEGESATGTSTTGSSEACMLAGLALKWRWRKRTEKAGKATDKPNLVMGTNVQVCWEKFCRYWDVEPRQVPVEEGRFHLGADEAAEACDENTIGVVAILGSTFDGSYEPVKDIAAALDQLQDDKGLDVPLHVDAASGGFVAPFIQPELEWDFRIPRVQSINASGHKYGLVYPGVGWAVWRNKDALPEELVFNVNYLGGNMPTFALNFSRPGSEVIAQYFMFAALGREGYQQTIQGAQDVAVQLSSAIAEIGPYELLSEGRELPVFAFRLKPGVENYTVYEVSDRLRMAGWLVPAYTFPKNLEDMAVLRIVVRAGMTSDMGDFLIEKLQEQTEFLESLANPLPGEHRSAFSHN